MSLFGIMVISWCLHFFAGSSECSLWCSLSILGHVLLFSISAAHNYVWLQHGMWLITERSWEKWLSLCRILLTPSEEAPWTSHTSSWGWTVSPGCVSRPDFSNQLILKTTIVNFRCPGCYCFHSWTQQDTLRAFSIYAFFAESNFFRRKFWLGENFFFKFVFARVVGDHSIHLETWCLHRYKYSSWSEAIAASSTPTLSNFCLELGNALKVCHLPPLGWVEDLTSDVLHFQYLICSGKGFWYMHMKVHRNMFLTWHSSESKTCEEGKQDSS